MRKYRIYFRSAAFVMLLAVLAMLSSCTKHFETFNTDQNGVTNDQLIPDNNSIGSFYPGIQYAVGANDPSGSGSLAGGSNTW